MVPTLEILPPELPNAQALPSELPKAQVLPLSPTPSVSISRHTSSSGYFDDEESVESASMESTDEKEKYLVVEISTTDGPTPKIKYIFKSPTEGTVRSWFDELKWRIQAHHHVKYDWVSNSESGEEDSSEVK